MFVLILVASLSGALRPEPVQEFQPCVWPNRCSAPALAPVLAEVPFQPCVWPNSCRG